ncbi:magnesium chelatase subunit ChlI family protein [Rickettsia canadensis]|uniref:Mg chelatase-related protein C-terminal domain-containing protein n=1 Tax=Rickettsia canadensis str. CA410 TaxID=1105107 RepID=A0ABM5MTV2_RICCA|nr:hypothetical protein [Rickettsia canadensis]AFB21274.1 hypothetical protein RCA_03575 [Rickettsia canadensis str. CA410]
MKINFVYQCGLIYNQILRVARTIADLENADKVLNMHIAGSFELPLNGI